jgi:hypothetical protein
LNVDYFVIECWLIRHWMLIMSSLNVDNFVIESWLFPHCMLIISSLIVDYFITECWLSLRWVRSLWNLAHGVCTVFQKFSLAKPKEYFWQRCLIVSANATGPQKNTFFFPFFCKDICAKIWKKTQQNHD